MKFDIVRAWKDETYRQSLTTEQLNTLPTNPAGELTDTDLSAISGSGDGAFGPGGAVNFVALTRNESAAVILCDVSIFSVIQAPIIPILSPVTQVCARG